MNSENFHEYLKNPSKLHQISYQELKSLTLQYPYSPNLRYLLLVKSLLDENKDFDRNLSSASLLSLDRKKLFQLVRQHHRIREMQENYALTEDFLELKDLSTIETILQRQAPAEKEAALQAENPSEVFDVGSLSPLADKSDRDFAETGDFQFLENIFEEQHDAEPASSAPAESLEATTQAAQSVEEIDLNSTVLEETPSETQVETSSESELPSLEEILSQAPEESLAIAPSNGMEGATAADLSAILESSSEPLSESPAENLPDTISGESLPDALAEAATPGGLWEEPELPAELESLPDESIELIEQEPIVSDPNSWTLEEELSVAPVEEIPEADFQSEMAERFLEDEPATEPAEEAKSTEIPFEITNESDATSPEIAAAPAPKTSFSSWLNQFQPPQPSILSSDFKKAPPMFSKKTEQPTPAQEEVEAIAAKSLQEPTGIVSETFARLLESQGQYEKAIIMYERLILANPEKSYFFAAQIEKLKKM